LFGNIIPELFEELDKDLKVNNTINVPVMTQAFTLDALGKAAFGYNFETIRKLQTQLIRSYNATMHGISDKKYSMFPILEKIPGFKRSYLFEHINLIDSVILDIIDKRKKIQASEIESLSDLENSERENKDLLYYMLKAEADEENLKKRLTTEELLNDLKVFLIAGHDTTASALSAAIYYLGKNPECQKKAREEVIKIIGDGEQDVIPTLDQIKGQLVIPNIYALHNSKNLWGDETHLFRPERFAGGEGNTFQSSYKFTPFGGGVRICVGMNFSLAEQRVFLAMFGELISMKE
ncbi:14197_t:CDS:2, partial [Acaulospora colombiana]